MGLALELIPHEKSTADIIMADIFPESPSSQDIASSLVPRIRTQVPIPDDFAFGLATSPCYTTLSSYIGFGEFRDYVAHLELRGQRPESKEHSEGMAKELAKNGGSRLFPHLLRHSDCSGWYVPVEFPLPILDNEHSIGSANRLLLELAVITETLGMAEPAKHFMGCVDYGSEHGWRVDAVTHYESVFQVKDWNRHDFENERDPLSSEKWIASALVWFCKASIHRKVAIEFC